MSTPISTLTPYCTPAQWRGLYDVRTLVQWLSDTDVPIDSSPWSVWDSGTGAAQIVTDTLMEASGIVESATLMSERYAVADLQSLIGASAKMLTGIVGDISTWRAWGRRPRNQPMPERCKWAMDLLDKLSTGTAIFGILEVTQAGVVDHQVESASDVEARAMVTSIARRYFGRRSNEYPTGQGWGPGGWGWWSD